MIAPCAFALLLPLASKAVPAPIAEPPNVVLILVDDLGWSDLGSYGGRAVPTPRLDELATEGMRFTQAYGGCVVCAPSRSVLMSGLDMGHTPVRLNTGGVPLVAEDVTLAERLREAGYATGGFGKWGLGELGTAGVPEKQGFDEFYGYYHQIHAHYLVPDYLIRNGEKEVLDGNAGFYDTHPRTGAFPRSDDGLERQYAPDLILEETIAFLRARRSERFFCYAPWTPPHGEFTIPADDPAWIAVAQKPWPLKERVAAAFTGWIDRSVGTVLDTLEELELANDTLVIFVSDHGADERFEDSLQSCGPLRGRKRSMYEGGLRVPMIARWPGRVAPGSVRDEVVAFQDFVPTLCELAGLDTPADLQGRSITPLLLGAEAAGHAFDPPDYRYWEWARYDWGKRRLTPNGLMQAARIDDWKAVRHGQDQAIEVYDLATDLGETRDLAAQRPELVERFRELFETARVPMREQQEPDRVDGRPYR